MVSDTRRSCRSDGCLPGCRPTVGNLRDGSPGLSPPVPDQRGPRFRPERDQDAAVLAGLVTPDLGPHTWRIHAVMEGCAGEQASNVVCHPERYALVGGIGDARYVRGGDDVGPT